MSYINVRRANCRNCYKCLKNCIVKSIKYADEKVEIIEDGCILCGLCITKCPQRAKSANNDIEPIRKYIKDKDTITAASLDPSYVSAFGSSADAIAPALKAMGFDIVEESAIGASCVSEEYLNLIKEGGRENIISSACPTVNMYIQKYYPELIDWLAPVMSPALAHGKAIKEEHGENVKVIHITPCLSRIKECAESPYVDGVITYDALMKQFYEEGITLSDYAEGKDGFDKKAGYSCIYPIVDGIVYDLQKKHGKDDGTECIDGYDMLSVSGVSSVKKMLDEMKKGNIKNAFIEASACSGGCVSGPFMPLMRSSVYRARLAVKKYADKAQETSRTSINGLRAEYRAEPVKEDMPSEEEIRAILARIGKYSRAQELNCGSCGYATCREKAIAVYQNKTELYLCMPYMTDINQAMSNVTLSLTPNYIIAVDSDMHIKEFNVAAQKLFGISRAKALNKKLSELIDTSDFENVINTRANIYDKKVSYPEMGIITEQTIVYAEERNMAIAIIKDVTQEHEDRKALYTRKKESVSMAQKVIDKQMVVAQQIASLLGETTAETKVTLNKLKNLIDAEEMNNG